MTDPKTLHDWLHAAEDAARRAAAVLEEWRKRFSVREKARSDLVTDADHASQATIHSYLKGRFPDHGFLGEEQAHGPDAMHGGLRLPADAPPTWIVDPIDGTANYVHDVPAYCVSIGLHAGGELVVGVVFDPRQNEMFSAARGLGAHLNGQKLGASTVPSLREALLATGFPPDPDCQQRNLEMWRAFSYQAQGLRRTGSTALNLAYVAAGRFDGYWAFDNYAWDTAGGVVLVREAGGVVTRADGSAYDPFRADILATNGHIHDPMLEHLRQRGG